jgi:hypothetical protein
MAMNYDCLTQTYWSDQIERVREVLEKINGQGQVALPGRVVPGQDDLVLGTGRTLKAAIMFTDISGFSARPCGTAESRTLC